MASTEGKSSAEIIGGIFGDFGATISEILDDPELKDKARDFATALVDAAANVAGKKVKDQEVRAKLRKVGKAAHVLGEKLEKHFNHQESD